jgi:multicomponent Na+:H+ antiporter subunit E
MLLISIFILFVFWLMVAGFSWQGMTVGLICAVAVAWGNRDLLGSLGAGPFMRPGKLHLFLGYLLVLLWQVVLANVEIAKILLSPQLPIQPGIVTFDPGLRTEFGRTLLANSITLTPGTLTLEVGDEGIFTVHALTIAAARDVVEWPLIKWLHMLEG